MGDISSAPTTMRILAALLACCASLAHAASTTTDFTDLWFNESE